MHKNSALQQHRLTLKTPNIRYEVTATVTGGNLLNIRRPVKIADVWRRPPNTAFMQGRNGHDH